MAAQQAAVPSTSTILPSRQELLDIARAHIRKSEYESVAVWGPLGSFRRIDVEFIKRQTGASKVEARLDEIKDDGFLGSLFPRKTYNLYLENPLRLPNRLSVGGGRETTPRSFIVYNAGNVPYAGVWLDQNEACLDEQYLSPFRAAGFTCEVAEQHPYPDFTSFRTRIAV